MLALLENNKGRLQWSIAGLLSLVWLIVYLTTVSPTVNFIDSGELIAAANEPGIAHAPGYPLYTLMGYVATHVLGGDIAWRMNAMSALWGALAVGALFLLLVEFCDYITSIVKPAQGKSGSLRTSTNRNVQPKAKGKPAKQGDKVAKAYSPSPRQANIQNTPAAAPTLPQTASLMWITAAATGASLLGASATFWSRTAQAKMYTLHFFLVFVLLLLALGFRRAYDRKALPVARRWLIALAVTLGISLTNHLTTILLVIPLAMLLFLGSDFSGRMRVFLRSLVVTMPLGVLPLLLYLYMPWRAAQHPIMNWGSTDNVGDFFRQISGWQFRPFLFGDLGGSLGRNVGLVSGYLGDQWGVLTWIVLAAGIVGAILLARANWVLFSVTMTYAVITLVFSLFYGISEIEPYMVPFYAMFAMWIGLAPASFSAMGLRIPDRQRTQNAMLFSTRTTWIATAVAALLAIGSTVVVYPKENYSSNRLAEQFVLNVFSQLPPNSILITDYWDFYAPTYYVQMLKNVRPDITLIDKSLLRYPFFTQQLQLRYPWLIEKSKDVVATFAGVQRKWVDGVASPSDLQALQTSYFDLMTSFVERNQPDHPAFLLSLEQCVPNVLQSCEANQIAPTWARQPYGLVTRLLPKAPGPTDLPPVPDFKLDGILVNPVSMDDPARVNTQLYFDAFQTLSAVYGAANQQDNASNMAEMATRVKAALDAH